MHTVEGFIFFNHILGRFPTLYERLSSLLHFLIGLFRPQQKEESLAVSHPAFAGCKAEMLSIHSPAQHEIWLTAILPHCRLQSNSHSHF